MSGHDDARALSRPALFAAKPARAVAQGRPVAIDGGPTDGEIVQRTLAGDRDAFELAVRRHEREIYVHLMRMTGHAEDAEDLTQETFLLALRGLSGFDQRQPLRPWLYRIATNAALSALRRRSPETVSLDSEDDRLHEVADPDCEPADKRLELEALRARLERALDGLAAEDGALFNLRYREEMSHKAIAATLGRKPGAVTVALHRLRARLRALVFGAETGKQETGPSKR